jgi:hypothetical protein
MIFEIGQVCVFRRTPGLFMFCVHYFKLLIEFWFHFFKLFCANKDHLDEHGRLQKGKIVGIGESHVLVGWIDSDNRHKIKSLDRAEVMLVKQPFLRRLPGMCSWNTIFVMFFTFIFYYFCLLTYSVFHSLR